MQVTAKNYVLGAVVALATLLALLAAACIAMPQQAYANVQKAANGLVYIYPVNDGYWGPELNKTWTSTYKKADVTGDKKKDKIQLVCRQKSSNGEVTSFTTKLKVNGKTVKTWKTTQAIEVVTLKNKNSYIFMDGKLYQVKKNKLKEVANLNSLMGSKALGKATKWAHFSPSKVKGNTIYCSVRLKTKALGDIITYSTIQVAYSKGKFKLKSSTAKLDSAYINYGTASEPNSQNHYIAKTTIKAKKSKSSSATSVTIKKGQTFQAKKISVVNNKLYVQVKAENSKTGWVKLGKSQLVTKTSSY